MNFTYKLGRFLQILGLIITPVGISGNLARPEDVSVKATLLIAGFGILLFAVGWFLQQSGRAR